MNQTQSLFKAAFVGECVKLYQSRAFKVMMIILIISILISGLLMPRAMNPLDHSLVEDSNGLNIILGTILFIVIGCTNSTNEYHFNTIYFTMLSVNSRRNIILAKALLLALLGFIVSFIMLICTCLLIMLTIYFEKTASDVPIFTPATIHECIFFPLFIAMLTVISFSIGIIIRNKTASIAFIFVWWLMVENLLLVIPKIGKTLYSLAPIANGLRSYEGGSRSNGIWLWNPTIGSVYFLIWTIVLLVVAERLFSKRNV